MWSVFSDDTILSICCPDVEDESSHTSAQCAEWEWLICNEPLTYAAMALIGTGKMHWNGPFLHNLDD